MPAFLTGPGQLSQSDKSLRATKHLLLQAETHMRNNYYLTMITRSVSLSEKRPRNIVSVDLVRI